jgi:hypothetical protein
MHEPVAFAQSPFFCGISLALFVSCVQGSNSTERLYDRHFSQSRGTVRSLSAAVRRATAPHRATGDDDIGTLVEVPIPDQLGPSQAQSSTSTALVADAPDIIGRDLTSSSPLVRKVVRSRAYAHAPVRRAQRKRSSHWPATNAASQSIDHIPEFASEDGAIVYPNVEGEVSASSNALDARSNADTFVPNTSNEHGFQVVTARDSLQVKSEDTRTIAPQPDYIRMAEGVGQSAYYDSPTDSRTLNYEIRHRLVVQDYVILGCALVVFAWTLHVSCCYVYTMSDDASNVIFYSDPSHLQPRATCHSANLTDFMQAFNSAPAKVNLRIIGKRLPEERIVTLIWRGEFGNAWRRLLVFFHHLLDVLSFDTTEPMDVIFDVVLDVSPFIGGDGQLSLDEDIIELQKFLVDASNPLEQVLLVKHVNWYCWEDVATNIRARLRNQGFAGEIEIHFDSQDSTVIFRNHHWANFVRSPVTWMLAIVSVVGVLFLSCLLWLQKRKRVVRTYFAIEVDIERFWELIDDSLHPAVGFTPLDAGRSTTA